MAATVTRGEAYSRARNLFELSQKSLQEERNKLDVSCINPTT